MKFLECDLEKIIMDATEEQLFKSGISVSKYKKNQVRIGNYGIADIIAYEKAFLDFDDDGNVIEYEQPVFTIYELKKDKVSVSSFIQAIQYMHGLRRYLIKTNRVLYKYNFKIVLIGRSVDINSVVAYLPELFNVGVDGSIQVEIFEYDYTIDGLRFNEISGYKLTNEGF